MAKVGRPATFEKPEDLLEEWESYVEEKQSGTNLIDKINFLNERGIYKNMFNEYEKKPVFSGVLEKIYNDCKYDLLNRGLRNEFNSTIVKLIASADYGMVEKSAQEHSGGSNPIQVIINKEDKEL